MKRAYSVRNVLDAKFRTLEFEGKWKDAIGCPELTGSWFIYGSPKSGKTSFAMQLVKYLSGFRRVAYNSIEEGMSLSIKMAMKREGMEEVGRRMVLVKMEFDELTAFLKQHKSPDVVVIDSVQFMEMKFQQYKKLKAMFPGKLFIYVSHVNGGLPDGFTARKIWRDANVTFYVQVFRALPISRYGGGEPIVISEEKARGYWEDK
jgi:hypothetical protein